MNPIPRLVPTAEELHVETNPGSPLGILAAQSGYMEDLTKGAVTSDLYFAGSGYSQLSFSFHLISKATKFQVSIFSVCVDPSMDYPVRISVPGDDHGDYIFSNESEFLEGVKFIFSSPKSIDIIRKLSWHT